MELLAHLVSETETGPGKVKSEKWSVFCIAVV